MPPVERVLVVDDSAPNRELLEAHLAEAGYAVTLAESGEEALRNFEARPADLVLLDVMMPVLDGFDTCTRLRRLPGGADVAVVFVTALADAGTHARALQSGGDDFLTKPVNRTELLLRVRSLLRIRRLTVELKLSLELIREQNGALQRLQAQKDELAALLVHDLKSPLAAVLTNAQYVASQPSLEEEPRHAVDDVITAAESMHRMVLNLLDISKSEDGALTAARADFRMDAMLASLREVMQKRAEERRQQLELCCEPADLVLHADRDLLERALQNLVDNALRYAPAGGQVGVRVRRAEDDAIEICVADDGPGVPEAYRDKIFDKYVQVPHDERMKARASRGLGLRFAKLAVEAHGGTIWVENREPRGAVFCARLPPQQAALRSAGAHPPAAAEARARTGA